MNQRIRDLAEHCDFYVGNEHSGKSREEQQRLFMEKFAELIVAEMLQTCEEHPGWTGRMIGEEIKQHFGVEK